MRAALSPVNINSLLKTLDLEGFGMASSIVSTVIKELVQVYKGMNNGAEMFP